MVDIFYDPARAQNMAIWAERNPVDNRVYKEAKFLAEGKKLDNI